MASCFVSHTVYIPNTEKQYQVCKRYVKLFSTCPCFFHFEGNVYVPYVHMNEWHFGNRNNEYLLNRVEFDSIGWKLTNLHPVGKPPIITHSTYYQCFFSDRNNAGYIPNPGRKPPLIVDKSDGVQDRVRAAAALCFISAAPARKLLLLASFGWAGSPQNGTHGTATAMQLSSKSWFILYGFGRFAWFSWHLAERARGKTGPATAMFFFEALTPGYAVLWSVCSRERGCCPSRHLLRFKIYLLVGGCR